MVRAIVVYIIVTIIRPPPTWELFGKVFSHPLHKPPPPQKSKPINAKGQPDPPQQGSHPLGSCFEKYLATPSTKKVNQSRQKGNPTHRSKALTPLGVVLKNI
jgi:hypothetical protein